MRSLAWVCGAIFVSGAIAFAGCSSKGKTFDTDAGDGSDNGDDAMLLDDAGTDGQGPAIIITPMNPMLNATGSPVTQQFTALTADTMMMINGASWSLDNVALGSIDPNGLFTAVGNVGGVSNVSATYNGSLGSTTVSVNVVMTENPGNVSMSDQMKLQQGGNADNQFRWLYPYDKTVFPRGLNSPQLQFDGQGASSVMIHMTAKYIDYTGYFSGSNPLRVQITPSMWKNVLASVGAGDPLTIATTKLLNGQAAGPIKETWTIAQGALRGTCYYNTYNNGGATIKLKIGQTAQQLVGGCSVCHSVSADGSTLSSNYGHQYGSTYDLTKPGPPIKAMGNPYDFSFPALYPDGSILLTTYAMNIPGMSQNGPPHLLDGKTGMTIAAPGIDNSNINPQMPAFSPDGKFIAFNRRDMGAQTIAMMNFDFKTKTFSKLTNLFTDNQFYPGWPQFTPDSKFILYHAGTGQDYATWGNNQATIHNCDVVGKKLASLDSLNGLLPNQNPYLPYGNQETNYNFEPTILPLAVGGYYWTIFTTRRFYGNIVTPASDPQPSSSRRKKLWIAAIDINATPGKDPSHPAFYLEGQDDMVGSLRGFWALDPCKQNGQNCNSGDECCNGFCRQVGNTKQCVPPPMGCSMEYEKCTVAADCCDMSALCIAGHCATPPPN